MDSFDVEQLIGSVIKGALGGKRKRSRGVDRFLTGGRSSFLNASTLLALGGLAWGVYETMTQSAGTPAPASGSTPPGPPPLTPTVAGGLVVPPPLPTSAAPVVPPPLPASVSTPSVSPEVLRVLRLTLSAACADGTLSAQERDAILTQARVVGAEAVVAPELDAPRPLAEIVAGIAEPRVRDDLYTLAFSIVRADEAVLDGERRYLDELARHLGLDAAAIARLEQKAAERIVQAARE